MALATIVIPSFNHSSYVAASIESVLEQDHPEIELLIIDDGSTDSSVEIINSYIDLCHSKFKRFEFITRENRGLARTLNEALSWSRGDMFSMLSSDDIMLKSKTAHLIDFLEKNNEISGVFAGINQIDADGNFLRTFAPTPGVWNFSDVLHKKCQLFAPAMLVRTSSLKSIGGYWEDIALEDRAITLKLAFAGHKLATLNVPLANYRWHPNNTIKQTAKMTEARLSVLNKFPQTREIQIAKAKALHGAAKEFAIENKMLGWQSFFQAVKVHKLSLFSKAALRAIKRLIIYKMKK